jgi:hypothetical protein
MARPPACIENPGVFVGKAVWTGRFLACNDVGRGKRGKGEEGEGGKVGNGRIALVL